MRDLKTFEKRLAELEDEGGGVGPPINPPTAEEWRALAVLRHVVRANQDPFVRRPERGISDAEWRQLQIELARRDRLGALLEGEGG